VIIARRSPDPLRPAPTLRQRINPIWWLGDVERNPNWSRWSWFKRNPCANFTMTIIGIAHKERDCYYSRSPWTYEVSGFNWGYSIPTGFPQIPFPFISYRGKRIEFALGWKTSGGFTMSVRRANSPNAEETP